ncbi:MAG: bacillithiol biosynthesis cysteine-adding enzyme BshC [Crocinitomicaceae bacterium]
MQIKEINRELTGIFSEQHVRMVHRPHEMERYVQRLFSEEMFVHQIEAKGFEFQQEQRDALVQALENQYKGITENRPNFERLVAPNAFTVTTGHQLTLLAGPMYFVVKILEVIKLAKELSEKHQDYDVIPVFWMASEDHDFEEIQSANVFNRPMSVDYEERGPVGRFSADKLDEFKTQILEFFGEDKRSEIEPLIHAYSGSNLADATRNLVHHLFGKYGLVIIDGDDPNLKAQYTSIISDELKFGKSEEAVLKTNESLTEDGFKIQVHVRPINLFYIEDGFRERIIRTDKGFEAGDKSWSESELLELVEKDPTHFSPNALLRPVYQEKVLPNLAYVGGAGEISYWLQLKGVFDVYKIVYPIIQVRNSVLWIDKTTIKKMDKINLDWKDVFQDADVLKKEYVKLNSGDDLDFTKLDEMTATLIQEIEDRALSVDPNMKQLAEVEGKRLMKQLEGLKAKLIKTSKGKHDQAMKSIDSIKDRLFPNGGLQERSANFLTFCADGVIQSRIETLYDALDPFSKNLIVLMETDSIK